MPALADLGCNEHLDVAERFFKLAESSDVATGDARAWTIVLEFYAAVHWVRAYIRKKNEAAQIASHDDVHRYFQDYPELLKVKKSYDFLKQASQAVRYYGQCQWPANDYERTRTAARQVKGWAVPKCKDA
jgi:hypothetical protein